MNLFRRWSASCALVLSALSAAAEEPAAWVKRWESFAAPPSGFVLLTGRARPELSSVLAHLPAPDRWPALADALREAEASAGKTARARRMRMGRWLVEELLGRDGKVAAEIEAARDAGELDPHWSGELLGALGKAADASPETKIKAFEAVVAEHSGPRPAGAGYVPNADLPDLVTLVGEERATILLRRALAARVALEPEADAEATEALARRLAIMHADTLAAPQWRLARSFDAVPLFEAMAKRFPPRPGESDYRFKNARNHHIIGLVLAERVEEAMRVADEAGAEFDLPHDFGARLGRGAHEASVHAFLHAYLAKRPESSTRIWADYRRLAVALGEREAMLALIRDQAADAGLSGEAKVRAVHRLALAELAVDDVAAGLPRLREALVEARRLEAGGELALEVARALLAVARVTEQTPAGNDAIEASPTPLLDEAAAALRELASLDLATAKPDYGFGGGARQALTALVEADREAEALAVAEAISAGLAELERKKAAGQAGVHPPTHLAREALGVRLRLAVDRGRWTEARELLEKADGWGAADVAGLIREDNAGKNEPPVGLLVARVLAAGGDPDGARRALEAQLVRSSGNDATYGDYLDLLGARAVPLFDALYSLDPYEERPLIWKAVLAAREGRHAEAERLAREAIAVDPSDGEQGRGDRMRVYAVLGAARDAQGDAAEAEFFDRVVRAIRLSEQADRWHAAGLYTRSIEGYRRALGLFADAYCVQSRLAIRLMEQGREEEALAHYQKAYELMPGSFGRVESHCFGCERAFDGERQQSVAERVFARMAESDPARPQVPYLLGYLREEQGRFVEAAELYRRAVALDPLYLNAWKKLAALADRMATPAAERDRVTLTLLKLDPQARHFYPDFDEIGDAAALWTGLAEARARTRDLPNHASVLPLPASAEKLKRDPYAYMRSASDRLDPARLFADRDFTRGIGWAAQSLR